MRFLSPIQDPEIAYKKQSIVDVLCQDSEGTKYIIEMQVAQSKGLEKRAQYYAAKAYSQQANQGDDYRDLKEIIFIAIANCVLFPDKTHYKSDHVILDRDNGAHDLKDFSFTFIELPKFTKDSPDQLESIIEKWCYFFKHAAETGPEALEQIIGQDTVIEKAYKALNQFYWTEEELMRYEQELKRVRDNAAVLSYATETGIEKGMQQGLQQGLQQGKKQATLKIAQQLLANGIERKMVKASTGLSDEELDMLPPL